MKLFKKILLITAAAALVTTAVIFSTATKKTVPNDAHAIGNSPGNLYNGGFFCLSDDTIYFSNPNDDGALYSMSTELDHFRKISTDKVAFLNATNEYLVYSRLNYAKKGVSILGFSTTGLFRINKSGKSLLRLNRDAIGQAALYGNNVYYQHFDEEIGLQLYIASLDGTSNKLLTDEAVIPASFYDDILCYAGTEKDHNLYGMDINTLSTDIVYEGNCYMPVMTEDYIYFISLANEYSLARIPKDGGKGQIVVSERLSSYNISEDERFVVYQIDGGTKNRLECLDLTTMETVTAAEGDFNCIHIIGSRVFYQSLLDGKIYTFLLDSPQVSAQFDPAAD